MDWYYEQLERTVPVTEQTISYLRNKKFKSGREIKIGDTIFYGYLSKGFDLHDHPMLELISFHKDELHALYQIDEQTVGLIFPTLIKI